MKYLEGLNPQQKEAVLTTDGPMMILAGAGSGKTKTIIAKIVHLIKTKNIQPYEVLAVTFSNRAANEMKERIYKQLPEIDPKSLHISTFHAFCAKILRYNAEHIGYKSSFTIYDEQESMAVAKSICRKYDLDPKKHPASALTHYFDQVKNQGFYLGRKTPLKKVLKENDYYPYFEEYEKELKNNNSLDFGSLITQTLNLFENNDLVLKNYNKKYKYLLVDEYQDTNKAQFDLISLLGNHQNVCVVGDSDQCLVPDSTIFLPSGKKTISELNQNEQVLSYDRQIEPFTISRKIERKYAGEIFNIICENNFEVSSTANHVHFVRTTLNPITFDECRIEILGGKNKLHRLYLFNIEKESNNLQELYDYFSSLSKSLDLHLKELFIFENIPFELVMAKNVRPGDFLPTVAGIKQVISIEKRAYSGLVYDLDINPVHNYIVNGILTHNSIYSWRGAEMRNILDFEKRFLNAKILKLEENYRSSNNIIQAATEVIKKNIFRKEKNMFTSNKDGEKIKVYQCRDGLTESLFIAQSISKLIKDKISPKEIAVFYRNNGQSRTIEDALRRYMIPYQIVGGLKFYERREVKDLVAYLQVVLNPFDEVSFLRIINVPTRGIGEKSLLKFIEASRSKGKSLFEFLSTEKNLGSKKISEGIQEIVDIISTGRKMNEDKKSVLEIFDFVLKQTDYIRVLKASNKYEDLARVENIQELRSSITQFINSNENNDLVTYLENITLDRSETNKEVGSVSLMTVHSSKGLEFDYVFVPGLEETVFPSGQSVSDGLERMEEERRLFYVAITRARKECSLLYAISRMMYGKFINNLPSRFVDELPSQNISKFRV